jgi:hypothetical protein
MRNERFQPKFGPTIPQPLSQSINIQVFIMEHPAPKFPEENAISKSPEELQEILDQYED